jgi:hypothetical protein
MPATYPIAEVVSAVQVSGDVLVVQPRRPWVRRSLGNVHSAIGYVFGLGTLFLGLAVIASLPIAQFLTLGYLLEASGRVARSGRMRDSFIGVRTAARIGGLAAGMFLLWLPLYAISYFAERARIIDPAGRVARQWEGWLFVLTVLYVLHVVAACLRDGRLRAFFWPLNILWLARRARRVNVLRELRDRLWDAVDSLRLPYYFWLGLRGFTGAFLYLFIPLALLGQGHQKPVLGILGGLMLVVVVLYLPFLQTRFARDNRFRAFFQLAAIRREFRRAPMAFALALCVNLLGAIPLYLLKIELIPRDLLYLEGLVFLAFIFPARLLDGWAYSRPSRRRQPRHWLIRWGCRLLVLPVAAVYVLVVYGSQYLGWYGVATLFDQHAFLLPVPFANR